MTLAAGTSLGPYEILGVLGVGGMGEVYRARDTRLDRQVAIKILPEIFEGDSDRLMRFEREARTLASLNHPHIAQIHGIEATDGARAIVMELVDGPTFADRLLTGPIELGEALAIARQIAEALEAAHDAGIIHRDLKPANIKVRADGVVKVLDFGLAKDAARDSADDVAARTFTSPAVTAAGVILGTAAYMSPEQARGKLVDRRADIWAFGVVLMEMLTGRHLFEGETVSDVMVSVLTRPVDLAGLPADVPPRVREVIVRCLERDPKRRLRDIGEARVALESSARDVTTSGVREVDYTARTVTPARSRWSMLPWAIAVASITTAAAFGVLWIRGMNASPGAQRLQLEIGPPWGEEFVVQSNAGAAVISPDGSMVAFLAQGPAGRRSTCATW